MICYIEINCAISSWIFIRAIIITVLILALLSLVDIDSAFFLLCFGLHDSTSDQAFGKSQCWEFIFASQIFETYYSVNSNSISKAHDGRKDLNLQFLNEEWRSLSVDIDELGLRVHRAYLLQVHVHDLAPLELIVIEVAHHELGVGHLGQKLLLHYLSVLTVPLGKVLLLCGVLGLHLWETLFSQSSHYLFFFFIKVVVIVLLSLLLLLDVFINLIFVNEISLLVL